MGVSGDRQNVEIGCGVDRGDRPVAVGPYDEKFRFRGAGVLDNAFVVRAASDDFDSVVPAEHLDDHVAEHRGHRAELDANRNHVLPSSGHALDARAARLAGYRPAGLKMGRVVLRPFGLGRGVATRLAVRSFNGRESPTYAVNGPFGPDCAVRCGEPDGPGDEKWRDWTVRGLATRDNARK
jgi:hypothetical protein